MIQRGVVFVNETVPYKVVAWMANKLYKEHYTVVPTRHALKIEDNIKAISYEWKVKNEWNAIEIKASTKSEVMLADSFEAFIFEHYYGYTKISDTVTEAYKIKHPSWKINKVLHAKINCNFNEMYGTAFGHLSTVNPDSVFVAEGSAIAVDWKRNRLQF